jgi:hypothetical protein
VLERISDLPDSVLGFKASGELTGDDYRGVLVPAVEAALAKKEKVRLLYVLGDEVTGFSAGAGVAAHEGRVRSCHQVGKGRGGQRQGVAAPLR